MYEELGPSRHTCPTSTTYLRPIFDAWNFHVAAFASLGFFDVSTTPKCRAFHGSKHLSSVWSGCHQTDRLFCLPIFPTKMLRCNHCSTWIQEGSFLAAKLLLCWVNFPCFRRMPRIWWVNWPLSKGANLQESPYLVSGPMTHLSQQLTSLLTPARHSIWSPFDTCSNEFLATWQSKPTRSPCKFSFKTSRSCAWSGGSPVPVHTNNWLRVFLFNSCAKGVGCRNAKRALAAKTTG